MKIVTLLPISILTAIISTTSYADGSNTTTTNSAEPNQIIHSTTEQKTPGSDPQMKDDSRAPTGQQCTSTTPTAHPAITSATPFPLGQLGACVNASACQVNSAQLKSIIASRYCQDANSQTCAGNNDCLNLDCKGRVSGAVANVITLNNCQNTGPNICRNSGMGGDYCLCNAEVIANAQINCGCTCTSTTLP